MSRLRVSSAARADLLEIWAYIAEENGAAADRVVDEIALTFSTLSCHPRMGRQREGFRRPLRTFPVGKYLIYYRLLKDGIEIYRVLHTARDAERHLSCQCRLGRLRA